METKNTQKVSTKPNPLRLIRKLKKNTMGASPTYRAEDLLTDDRFLEWIHSNKQQHDKYWQDRLYDEPSLRTAFDQATQIAQALSVKKKVINTSNALAKLEAKINSPTKPTPQPLQIKWSNYLKIAATIVLLLSLSWSFWPQKQSFQTAFGELQIVTLPDATEVTLRANSKLWWNGDWKKSKKRIVYLEGEAYFDVRPTKELKNKRPFVVKAMPLEVEVLGTEFNIVNRPNRTNIVLVEGKVAVITGDQQQQLKPQQQYAWNTTEKSGTIQTVNTELFTDWQQHIWHFNNTSLAEVALLLEQHFGKKVFFHNPLLKDQKLNGTAPSSSLETLLNGIASSLNISITNQSDRIIIGN